MHLGENEEKIRLLVDVETKRPACVLLQAVYGCRSGIVSSYFDTGTWLLAPTDTMAIVAGTVDEWRRHSEMINEKYGKARPWAAKNTST